MSHKHPSLNMSQTNSSCPAGWTTGRHLFLLLLYRACCLAREAWGGGVFTPTGLLVWGPLCRSATPLPQKERKSSQLFPHCVSRIDSFSSPHHSHPAPAPLRTHIPSISRDSLKIYLEFIQPLLRPGLRHIVFSLRLFFFDRQEINLLRLDAWEFPLWHSINESN